MQHLLYQTRLLYHRIVWLALLVLLAGTSVGYAQCTGAGGVPFNCAPGGTINGVDQFLGGQSGNTVSFTANQITQFVLNNPLSAAVLTGLTVNGATSLNGNLSVSGTATMTATAITTMNAGTANVSNLLTASSASIDGATHNPGATAFTPLLVVSNWTGSYTGANVLCAICETISTDTMDGTTGGGIVDLALSHNVGAGAKHGRTVIKALLNINGAISGDTTSQQYQTGYLQAQASANVGGTDTASNSKGSLYGVASQAILQANATNWTLVNAGGEADLAVQTGATVADEVLGSWVLLSSHIVAGARSNLGLAILSQIGAAPTIGRAFVIGGLAGPWELASSGTVFGTLLQNACANQGKSCLMPPELATYGVDLASVNFTVQSGNAFRSAGFAVDGAGQMTAAGGLVTTATASGYSLDIPNGQKVVSVIVAATGGGTSSYYPGDIVYGPNTGQYRVTNTQAVSAVVVAGGSNGTNGSCTVVATTGTGIQAQFNVTIAGGAITTVNSVAAAGTYTVNPSGVGRSPSGALNGEPVVNQTGCGGIAGATLNIQMGALTMATLVGDVVSACPGTGGITPTGGSGAGLTLTPNCNTRSTLAIGNAAASAVTIGNGSSTMTLSGTVTAPNLTTTPGGKQPVCVDTSTHQLYNGTGGAC